MTNKFLQLTIARVDEPIFDGEVIFVTLPGSAGEMTLLANHSALISPLKKGKITIKKVDGSIQEIEIESGTLEVNRNHATVLI